MSHPRNLFAWSAPVHFNRAPGQRRGFKEADDDIWPVGLMRYDLGYIDLEQRTRQTLDNPFGARL